MHNPQKYKVFSCNISTISIIRHEITNVEICIIFIIMLNNIRKSIIELPGDMC